MVVLPDHVFAKTAELSWGDRQDEDVLHPWVDPHQLKKINRLWTRQGKQVVTGGEEEKRHILGNCHDPLAYRHPGISRTIDLVEQHYWWPGLQHDALQYVKGCTECQRHKVNTRPTKAPLQLIFPKPKAAPFEVIAVDFITKLPPSQGYDSILTVTDHDCTKAVLFIPCNEAITSEETAAIFITHVFKHFGLPNKITSDRDPRFASRFTREVCCILGIMQNISTMYHPRTDRQSEHNNQWVETYLRFFVNHQQDDWATYLPMAEFAHNNWKSETTRESPFHLLMGYHPHADWNNAQTTMPQVAERLEQLKEARKTAQELMTRVQTLWIKHNTQIQRGRHGMAGRTQYKDRTTHGQACAQKAWAVSHQTGDVPSHLSIRTTKTMGHPPSIPHRSSHPLS